MEGGGNPLPLSVLQRDYKAQCFMGLSEKPDTKNATLDTETSLKQILIRL